MVTEEKVEEEIFEIDVDPKLKQPCDKGFTTTGTTLWVTEGYDNLWALFTNALTEAATLARLACKLSDCKSTEFVKLKKVELIRRKIDGVNRKQVKVEVEWKCVRVA